MALKIDRNETGPGSQTDIGYFMNETSEAGRIVSHVTASSGVGGAMDDPNSRVQLPNNVGGSGEHPAGMLLSTVVNIDLTRQHLNQYQREVQVGGKVSILRKGQETVNTFESGYHPAPGDKLYFTADGYLTNTSTNSTQVGRAMTAKDSDGYARVEINII